MRLFEEKKIVPVLLGTDVNGGYDCDSIDMKNYSHAAFIVLFGAGLSGDCIATLNSGVTNAAKTTAMTFAYTYTSGAVGAASNDILATPSTSAALTCTGITFVSRMLVIEVDAMSMTDGHRFLTLSFNSDASAGIVYVVAVLTPKYPADGGYSALD